jgi:hypothetical protein
MRTGFIKQKNPQTIVGIKGLTGKIKKKTIAVHS